ncbi:MAG: hypothetical protein JSR17_06765 [Proteobacteria bacterium]|nr:hypothetical protein [Pseudomonadota bacterium]
MGIKPLIKPVFVLLYLVNALFMPSLCIGHESPVHILSFKMEPFLAPQTNCIKVKGSLKGKTSGEYLLRLPASFSNLQFNADSKKISLAKTYDPKTVRLIHYPGEDINFSYDVCINNPYRNVRTPIIEGEFIEIISELMLLTPDEEPSALALINIDLTAFPDDLKTVTSYNHSQRKFQVATTINDFRDSVFAIGDFNLDKININENDVLVVTNGTWSYFEHSPSDYVKEVLKAQRNFWNDHHFPHYVVFLVKQNKHFWVPKHITGKHWHNVAIINAPEEKELFSLLLYSLSHEVFHAWVGEKMKIEQPQGGLQWFLEGFNDYYGLYISQKSNLISLKEYIEIYNLYMQEYLLSPLKNVSNQTIKEKYQFFGPFAQIAQIRGHFLANQLRNEYENNGENKFDKAMRDLFLRYQEQKWPNLTEARIDAVFQEHVGAKAWEEFKNLVNSGKDITFSPTVFLPYAKLVEKQLDVPEFGFNLSDLYFNNSISQVEVNSNAYQAGLRNGQKVKSYDINPRAKDKIVTITAIEDGAEKIIKFKPKVVQKRIPQYVLVN